MIAPVLAELVARLPDLVRHGRRRQLHLLDVDVAIGTLAVKPHGQQSRRPNTAGVQDSFDVDVLSVLRIHPARVEPEHVQRPVVLGQFEQLPSDIFPKRPPLRRILFRVIGRMARRLEPDAVVLPIALDMPVGFREIRADPQPTRPAGVEKPLHDVRIRVLRVRTGRVRDLVVRVFRVVQAEPVVVLRRQEHVLEPALHGLVRPLFGIEPRRIEPTAQVEVEAAVVVALQLRRLEARPLRIRVRQSPRLDDTGRRVDAEMQEERELLVLEPLQPILDRLRPRLDGHGRRPRKRNQQNGLCRQFLSEHRKRILSSEFPGKPCCRPA